MGDLRERLIAAKLAGTKTADGYTFRSNENATGAALVVVAAWLRDEATNTKKLADLAESQTGRTVLIVQAEALDKAADSIVCDQWWDSVHGPGWDQHMAYVGLRALADSITGDTDG